MCTVLSHFDFSLQTISKTKGDRGSTRLPEKNEELSRDQTSVEVTAHWLSDARLYFIKKCLSGAEVSWVRSVCTPGLLVATFNPF